MINKKMIALMTTGALLVLLALAGCGGSQPSSSSAASTSAASSTAASSATAKSAAASSASATASSSAAASVQSNASYIGNDAAKAAALAHAGIAEANCAELKVNLDTDDATVHYDVEFKSGGMEYDYDIDPVSGAILKSKAEVDD